MKGHKCIKVISLKVILWVGGLIATIIFGLTGIVYSNLNDKIDSKASVAEVAEMKKEVHMLLLMHLRNGYAMPESEEK
jgi:uncharacterized membrane protein